MPKNVSRIVKIVHSAAPGSSSGLIKTVMPIVIDQSVHTECAQREGWAFSINIIEDHMKNSYARPALFTNTLL